jgi:drug/metabolite transporter (DMT)-like permease
MYLAYIESFRYLRAYEAALFTITTPIFVTLFADALDRTLRPWALAAALLAVVGTALVALKSTDLTLTLAGLALVQFSNATFAAGQVLYRRLRARHTTLRDHQVFALLYAGAFGVAAAAMATRDISVDLRTPQLLTLLYLGLLASGGGFFLWNVGATRVSAGTLAVMNNAKVPLGVACALLVFGEQARLPWLAASLVLMGAAVWLAERRGAKT